MKKVLFRLISLIIAAVFCLSLASCSQNSIKILKSSAAEMSTVKTVGGYDVPMELYRYFVLNFKNSFDYDGTGSVWEGELRDERLEKLYTEVNKSILQIYANLSIAQKYGIDPYGDEITRILDVEMSDIYSSYSNDYRK